MNKESTYRLSFTAASLRLGETVTVAKAAYDAGISNLKDIRDIGVVFNSVKSRTTDREFREIRKRLEHLTPKQIDILVHGDFISQKQIAFLAVCKHYDFIRDFTIDVIRDKALVFDYTINESDFNSFIKNKQQIHPELEEFSESTFKKGKQVMFHILEQAGIINNAVEKMIQPQLLNPSVVKAIAEDDQNLLKIFMVSDRDIKEIKH
jgi:hypothetical protein